MTAFYFACTSLKQTRTNLDGCELWIFWSIRDILIRAEKCMTVDFKKNKLNENIKWKPLKKEFLNKASFHPVSFDL